MTKKGGTRKKATLTRPEKDYTFVSLRYGNWTDAEKRKEYSRLRSIARKRLERMAKNWSETNAYKYNVGRFIPLAQVQNEQQLNTLLFDVARFLTSRGGSAQGQREMQRERIKQLREKAGLTWINEKNFDDFVKFMEYSRAYFGGLMYDSDQTANLFEGLEKSSLSASQMQRVFRNWADKKKKESIQRVKRMKQRSREKRKNSAYVKKLLFGDD